MLSEVWNVPMCLPGGNYHVIDGRVKTTVSERRLDDINDIFAEMKEGQIEGRIVLWQL
jgi:hypothetical protein